MKENARVQGRWIGEHQVEETPDTFVEEAETMGLSSKWGKSLDRGPPASMAALALSYKASLTWYPPCLPLYGLSFATISNSLFQQ